MKIQLVVFICLFGVVLLACESAPPPPPPPPPAGQNPPPSAQGQPPAPTQSQPPASGSGQQPPAPTQNQPATTATSQPAPTAPRQPPPNNPAPATAAPMSTQAAGGTTVDVTRLPIGDKKVSTNARRGYVWSCQTNFVPEGQAGAQATGAWYNAAAGIYNFKAKPVVDGQVTWQGQLSVQVQGNNRVLAGNALPNHPTGQYPVNSNDDAYQFDRNPNRISAQTVQLQLPANPIVNAQASCVGGEVGILLTGAPVFNAFDAGGRDAVAHEIQDGCQGHPQVSGVYHYHSISTCAKDTSNGHSALVGYALDGFGLYGYHGEDGKDLTNAQLDDCHGHTHEIAWDGKMVTMYHYHATWEFPYTVGCYRGTAVRWAIGGGGQPGGPPPGGTRPPPPRP